MSTDADKNPYAGMTGDEFTRALEHDAAQRHVRPTAEFAAKVAEAEKLRAELLVETADIKNDKTAWPKICRYANLVLEIRLAEAMLEVAQSLGVEGSWLAALPARMDGLSYPPGAAVSIDVATDAKTSPMHASAPPRPVTLEDLARRMDRLEAFVDVFRGRV